MIQLINTLFIGKVLHEFDELDSTNNYAQNLLAAQSPPEGTLIITHNQYAGRGQLNNKWESSPNKNLTFSAILYPKFLPARNQFLLNQVVSLSVLDTLNHYIPDGVTIKWPNDIYVFDKKITGILIQNSLQGNNLQSSIIGIGINVNQKEFLSDAPNPTSAILEIGIETPLKNMLYTFCENLEKNYLLLKGGHEVTIKKRYLANLYRLGQQHLFKEPDGNLFKGTILGVTEIGKLIIKTDNGEMTFGFKELQYIS